MKHHLTRDPVSSRLLVYHLDQGHQSPFTMDMDDLRQQRYEKGLVIRAECTVPDQCLDLCRRFRVAQPNTPGLVSRRWASAPRGGGSMLLIVKEKIFGTRTKSPAFKTIGSRPAIVIRQRPSTTAQ